MQFVFATLLLCGLSYTFEAKEIGVETKCAKYKEFLQLKLQMNAMKKDLDDIREVYEEEKKTNMELKDRVMTLEREILTSVDFADNQAQYTDVSIPTAWSDGKESKKETDFFERLTGRTDWNTSDIFPQTHEVKQNRKRATAGQQVAFYVSDIATGQGSWAYHQTLVFSLALIDYGGDYNIGTGLFVCRVAGAYVFHISIYSRQSTSYEVVLVRNGSQTKSVVFMQPVPPNEGYTSASNSAIIQLVVGDRVWLRLEGNVPSDLVFARGENTFAGFLLYPD